jgi:hypothetical protein
MNMARARVLLLLDRYCKISKVLTIQGVHALLYHLQEAGEALRLRFKKETWGPCAENLHRVLETFEGHFVLGFGEGRNPWEGPIRVLDDAVQEAEELVAAQPRHGGSEWESRMERIIKSIEVSGSTKAADFH